MKYISKPVEIEAIQWTGWNFDEIERFCGTETDNAVADLDENMCLQIWNKLQGQRIKANHDDYIIKGTRGEFYPCGEHVFLTKYKLFEAQSYRN